MKRGFGLVLSAMLAAGWLGACGGGGADDSAMELRRGNGSEPDSIDPQLARMEASMTILRDCYEGLVSMAPDGSPIAGAAESWSVSEDGRRYTFRLRPAARWSNGDRLVAEDFVAAFRRLVNPATASQYALMLEPVVNAADIVAGRKSPESLGVRATDAGNTRGGAHRAEPVLHRDALASEHLPGTSRDACRETERVRPARLRSDERRLYAIVLGNRLAHPCDPEHELLERQGEPH